MQEKNKMWNQYVGKSDEKKQKSREKVELMMINLYQYSKEKLYHQ